MKRRLSEADRRAWEAYRRTADPLDTARGDPEGEPQDPRVPPKAPPKPAVSPFALGQAARPRSSLSAHDLAPSVRDTVRQGPVQMDRRAYHRLKAGKLRPEAKLDLHGMTLEVAHPALVRFIQTNHARGRRLLLIVTGKGKRRDEGGPIPTRMGVLRHQVPQWLRMPPLAPMILQITEAHQSHGGLGAYYVYLRRAR